MSDGFRSWQEVLPWLDLVKSRPRLHPAEDSYYDHPLADRLPDDTRSEVNPRLLADPDFNDFLANWALISLQGWTLGSIFPCVSSNNTFRESALSRRTFNVLSREGFQTFGDIAELPLQSLIQLRSFGLGSYRDLFQYLTNASESSPEPGNDPIVFGSVDVHPDDTVAGSFLEEVLTSFDVLYQWCSAQNQNSLFSLTSPGNEKLMPPSVLAALEHVRSISPEDWGSCRMGTDYIRPKTSETLERLAATLDERDRFILIKRIAAEQPQTLDDLGRAIGITRERVRQVESQLLAKLQGWLQNEDLLEFDSYAVRNFCGPLTKLNALTDRFPDLLNTVTSLNMPAWYVLDKIDDSFESDGRWVAQPSLAAVKEDLELRFNQVSDGSGFAHRDTLLAALSDWYGTSESDLTEWVLELGYKLLGDDFVHPRIKSLPDLAFVLLSITGTPLTPENILNGLGVERSLTSLKNALGDDPRFMRTDRTEWGLTTWNIEEYTNIRDAIANLVREQGALPIDTVVKELTSKYSVAPASVSAYSNSWPLQTVDGIVSFASTPKKSRRSISETKNLYAHGTGLSFAFTISNEHLRGSGMSIPTALADHLNLAPGNAKSLESEGGPITFTWRGNQPAVGSIRALLTSGDFEIGQKVLLDVQEGLVRIRETGGEANLPEERLRILLDLGPEDDLEIGFSAALGFASTLSWASIIAILTDRDDSDALRDIRSLYANDEVFAIQTEIGSKSRFKLQSISDLN